MPDVPIAVLFNKTDRKEAVGEEYLSDTLSLGVHRTGKVGNTYQALFHMY